MIKTLYKPKRWRNGKSIVSRLYSAKIRVDGEHVIRQVALGVSDKDAAREKLDKLVKDLEREKQGLLPPMIQRESAQSTLKLQIQHFVGDLRAKGRNQRYVNEVENKLVSVATDLSWLQIKDVTADSFIAWREKQKMAPKTLNEYLTAAKSFFNWMLKHGRISFNPLSSIGKTIENGREVLIRRAYTDSEMRNLLAVSETRAIVYMTAALTGLRHGELKKLAWSDLNLNPEKPYVLVRASISKNHKQACIPLHRVLFDALRLYRPENAAPEDLVFGRLVARSKIFIKDLRAAGITKKNAQGKVLDFHSFRHTFCTNLHLAGVPLREAMELMRHSDARLTMKVYADTSMFSLRPAIEKLPWNCSGDDAQRDAQKTDTRGLAPSLPVTVAKAVESAKNAIGTGIETLSVVLCHGVSQNSEMVRAAGFEPATPTV